MAPESSSKARILSELSRSRQSSPHDDNVYMTATGTSFQDVLHSTPLRASPQHALHLTADELPETFEHGSDGSMSMDMSIEIGRGIKGQRAPDFSSGGIFTFGNDDSQYEITNTPPIPPRNSQRKTTDGLLRRNVSIRRAAESAKANGPLKRTASASHGRAAPDALPKVLVDSDNSHNARDFAHFAPPVATRNTRFVASRQPSINGLALPTRFVAGQGLDTPQGTANLNATVQSATYTTNQSFMLPDIPDITELVSGVRRDGTPGLNRSTKSRSRFTSGSFKPQGHRAVESLDLPDEEKAIFASLQTLKDRISELEAEKTSAQKRADRFEGEVIDLRNQLQGETKQLASDVVSEDDTPAITQTTKAATKLEASLKAVQDRFNRSERKVVTAQIAVQRITKERDALVTQIAAAYFSNEELVRENEELRASQDNLLADMGNLKDEIDVLRIENEDIKAHIAGEDSMRNTKTHGSGSTLEKISKARKIQGFVRNAQSEVKETAGQTEGSSRRKKDSTQEADLASRIEREVQRYRADAAARIAQGRRSSDNIAPAKMPRVRSKSKLRTTSANSTRALSPRRTPSARLEEDVSEAESTTELDLTRQSQASRKRTQNDSRAARQSHDQDITVLSDLDENMVASLRKKIEEEHRARRLQHQPSTSATSQGVRRRSSLKSVNDAINDGTGRFSVHSDLGDNFTKTEKTVRVQSPHTSDAIPEPTNTNLDAGDISILSNTSRRRRRASSTEGMTSAFIIPDITIQPNTLVSKTCIPHNAANCTACPTDKPQAIEIPTPTPVSERVVVEDVTDATIRPAQAPGLALATVIKHLEDEITHLKISRDAQNRLYTRHDPAVSQRRRRLLKTRLDLLTAAIEKRSDQVYALYDVLEGQRLQAQTDGKSEPAMAEEDVEETLMSVGLDPAELSGRIGRSAPVGLEQLEEWSEDSEELPWEGLSDVGSE